MTKGIALAGRLAVERLGADITRTFKNTSTVYAAIDPELAPVIRDNQFVNYVEPAYPGKVTGPRSVPIAALKCLMRRGTQDTTWGVLLAKAPIVWGEGDRV